MFTALLALTLTIAPAITPLLAPSDEPVYHYNVIESGLALNGYDPVAYFQLGVAIQGNAANQADHRGVLYWFTSAENKELFLENPDAYLPQYGGWCAFGFAVEPGEFGNAKPGKFQIDPTSFVIEDGKLYLFYKGDDFDAKKFWNRDPAGRKARADAFWKQLIEASKVEE